MSTDALSRRLVRWGVSSTLADRLSRRHSSVLDLLTLTPVELVTLTNRNPEHDRQNVVDVIATNKAPAFKSVSKLSDESRDSPETLPVPSSLRELDEALGGGLPLGSITEFVGPPGAGKTQFCLMLSAVVASTNVFGKREARVAYVDTEGAFSSKRLFEIFEEKFRDRLSSGVAEDEWKERIGDSVMVYQAPTCAKLMTTLEKLDSDVILKNYRLVILDSIASTVRREFHGGQSDSLVDRSKLLAKIAKLLKELAQHHDIPVVVTNQITTQFGSEVGNVDEENGDGAENGDDDDVAYEEPQGVVTAALGNSWSHFVNVRLSLDYDVANESTRPSPPRLDHSSSCRRLKLLKSPFARQIMLSYVLTKMGLKIVSDAVPINETGGMNLSTKSAVVLTSY